MFPVNPSILYNMHMANANTMDTPVNAPTAGLLYKLTRDTSFFTVRYVKSS